MNSASHYLPTIVLLIAFTSSACASANPDAADSSQTFQTRITDAPLTFTNPITVNIGSERSRRAGEPVVVLHQDAYYLFVTGGGGGYWTSDNLRDWSYIEAPNFPGGCPSVVSNGEMMYASGDKGRRDVFASTDPANGVWEKVGYYDREYGDANMFWDDDGRLYLYWGWSQILPFQVVELDPENGFREKGEPRTLFFGDYEAHGFERRRPDDVIWSIFSYRDYLPEENPWIEGPFVMKHNGTYYLQYAAIGLELSTYSHGVYVSDNPLGPFTYSPHNPLTFKTTGFMVGAGHGSTFHDKNGQLWTITMVPTKYGERGTSELALFPTAIDGDGVMYSNTAFGDYPQYYPGVRENAVDNSFTGWMLLSHKKRVEVSSALEGFSPANAVDEDFMTYWSAASGKPGEYLTVDLGFESSIHALQINFDRHGADVEMGRGFRMPPALDRYQSYTVEASDDGRTWSTIVDKSNNEFDHHHDYIELGDPVNARYVRLTNVFTHDGGNFAVKDLRVFGNPDKAKFTKVSDVTAIRDPEDPRNAKLLWQPVDKADGYVVRYGIEPDKLYNSALVYDDYSLTLHSLNRDEEYHFEVEAFDSGTDYYRENTRATMGIGAEIQLMRDGELVDRKMIREGVNEYVFEGIVPGDYRFVHTFGPLMWSGNLTAAEVIGSSSQPTITETVTDLGVGTKVTGHMDISVIPGTDAGRFVVSLKYD